MLRGRKIGNINQTRYGKDYSDMLVRLFMALSAAVSIFLSVYNSRFSSWSLIWMLPLLFILCFVGFLLLFTLFFAAASMFIDRKKPPRKTPFFRCLVLEAARLGFSLLRVEIHATGLERLHGAEPFVLVSNHRSMLDPLLTMLAFPEIKLGFIAKDDLFRIPVVRKYLHQCCCISLDRQNLRSAAASVMDGVRMLQGENASMGVYPEGTRNPTDALLRFRNGAFKLATMGNVPVAVMTVQGSESILKKWFWKKKNVLIHLLAVMTPEQVNTASTHEISEWARAQMEQDLRKPGKKVSVAANHQKHKR